MFAVSKALENNSIKLNYNAKINFSSIVYNIKSAYNHIEELIDLENIDSTNQSDEKVEEVDSTKTKPSLSEIKDKTQIIYNLVSTIWILMQMLNFLCSIETPTIDVKTYIEKTINILNSLNNDNENIINNSLVDDNSIDDE